MRWCLIRGADGWTGFGQSAEQCSAGADGGYLDQSHGAGQCRALYRILEVQECIGSIVWDRFDGQQIVVGGNKCIGHIGAGVAVRFCGQLLLGILVQHPGKPAVPGNGWGLAGVCIESGQAAA